MNQCSIVYTCSSLTLINILYRSRSSSSYLSEPTIYPPVVRSGMYVPLCAESKDRLVFILMFKRSLYLRTWWHCLIFTSILVRVVALCLCACFISCSFRCQCIRTYVYIYGIFFLVPSLTGTGELKCTVS